MKQVIPFVAAETITIACPFCASHRVRAMELDCQIWAVCCLSCQSMGPHAPSEERALESWLKRLIRPEPSTSSDWKAGL